MRRITSNNTRGMDMHQLALNQVYIEDGWAWYQGSTLEHDQSVCDLIRAAAETLMVELPILSDDALSDLMTDWLQYGEEEPEGILAVLYRALCAIAELRDKLSRYEDTGLEPEEIKEVQEAMEPIPFWRFHDIMEVECAGRLVLSPEANVPLTLEELLGMDGEPVWLHTFSSAQKNTKIAAWAIVETVGAANVSFLRGGINCRVTKWFANYGNTWLAYRRKPEEGAT